MRVTYPKRICCLTEETTEILYLLGEEERIVGISGFTVRPKRARQEKPKVSTFTHADIPELEALKPDLVLAFSDIQADITRELVALGHTVFTFNQRSVAEILSTIAVVGSLVGKQAEAEALAESLARRVEEIGEKSSAHSFRPRIYFEEWPDPMISGIRWVSELIEVAGGTDIFADLSRGSLAKERIIEPGEVPGREPQGIVASWCGKKVRKEQIRSRPGWGATSAVQRDCIFELDSSLILQPGPAALTDGLDALERIVEQVRARHQGA